MQNYQIQKNNFKEELDKPEVFNITAILEWPIESLIPAVDLNRIFFLHYFAESLFTGIDKGFGYLGKFLKLLNSDGTESLKMVTLRALCNVFTNTASTRSFLEITDLLV